MTENEKIEFLADVLEMDTSELSRDTVLAECGAWDSIAVLSVIAIMNEKFNKFPSGDVFKKIKTLGELMDMMVE